MISVEVENLSKRFRRQTVQPYTTIKSAIVDVFRRRWRPAEAETFEVLSGITFSVQQGQTLSIIGRNGSGKSTIPRSPPRASNLAAARRRGGRLVQRPVP